jgi:hypothetical protein
MDQMLGRHGETCVVSVCGQVDQPFDQLECYRRRRGTWHSIDVARVHYTLTRVVADQSNLTEMNGAAFLSLHLDASVFIQAIRQGKAHADLGAQSLDDHSALAIHVAFPPHKGAMFIWMMMGFSSSPQEREHSPLSHC